MYQHLLVPIDGSHLSVEVVGNAVALARALGARITFFHAVADHGRSLQGDVEVLRLTSPELYDYAVKGRSREILAKAEAAARAFGVPCESLSTMSDKVAEAIMTAARDKGCDLIFMASHGHRGKLGMALASDTLSVVMNAGLPVLVSSTGEPPSPARAIAIIRDEHRALAAVLQAWSHLLARARIEDTAADPVQMRAILSYMQNFPVALHHPKEEMHIFRRLRQRTESVTAELDELERQHVRDHVLIAELNELGQLLARASAPAAAIAATRSLEEAVTRYANFHWEHMGREESVILPAAQRHLTPADWTEIDAAFTEDPGIRISGELDTEYHHLLAQIVALAGPSPIH
jgi:nucleotide-binding universal stress UspA family protein/hemerythrin-like domain-containing protein